MLSKQKPSKLLSITLPIKRQPNNRRTTKNRLIKWNVQTIETQTRTTEMTLTKADLVESLIDETELNKDDAKSFVNQFFEEVKALLESGQQVKLSGFGNFDVRDKKQRPGRNPKTGEDIPITARRVVTFKPGNRLKAKVEDYSDSQR